MGLGAPMFPTVYYMHVVLGQRSILLGGLFVCLQDIIFSSSIGNNLPGQVCMQLFYFHSTRYYNFRILDNIIIHATQVTRVTKISRNNYHMIERTHILRRPCFILLEAEKVQYSYLLTNKNHQEEQQRRRRSAD